jgi:dTDP-4-amino-4,6-dideoxygalactose transaminase
LQAIVGNYVFETLDDAIHKRIAHAERYDKAFLSPRFKNHLRVPPRNKENKHVFHLYKVDAKKREGLLQFLVSKGIGAKVHYPIPLHLQEAAKRWKYKKGDFPVTESECENTITFPCHQYLNSDQIDFTISKVAEFYNIATA